MWVLMGVTRGFQWVIRVLIRSLGVLEVIKGLDGVLRVPDRGTEGGPEGVVWKGCRRGVRKRISKGSRRGSQRVYSLTH